MDLRPKTAHKNKLNYIFFLQKLKKKNLPVNSHNTQIQMESLKYHYKLKNTFQEKLKI